jgi:hypothetical protein
LRQVDTFLGGILADAARFFVFGQQWRQNAAGSDMVAEFQPVTDDLVDTEMERHRPDLEIERAGDQTLR